MSDPSKSYFIERENPGPLRLQPAAHDTTPAAAQQGPDQHPSTQGVDFSQDAIDPDNPFTRQYIERLEADIKQSEARVAKEQRILQKQLRHRKEADKYHHRPCPGEWPSEPTLPRSDIGKRGSCKQKGAVPRSTRVGVDTHARHNERASRLETVSLQSRMLDGLMLTLTLEWCLVSHPRLTGPEEVFIDSGVDGIRFIRSFDFSMVEGVFCFLM